MTVDQQSASEIYKKRLPKAGSPYRHQIETFEHLAEGRSVVLRAPTGSGKTEAVILPFLEFRGVRLPNQLIYSLPMRVLADDLKRRTCEMNPPNAPSLRVVSHHGRQLASSLFYADILFTTIDQTVGAYACVPLSLPLRHGNIPAGAVAS